MAHKGVFIWKNTVVKFVHILHGEQVFRMYTVVKLLHCPD